MTAFVADTFELLNEEGANPPSPKRLRHVHVDIAIWTVVMEQNTAARRHLALGFDDSMPLQLIRLHVGDLGRNGLAKYHAGWPMLRAQLVVKQDRFTDHLAGKGMQHRCRQVVVALDLDRDGAACPEQRLEQIEHAQALVWHNVELVGGWRPCPGPANSDGTVARCLSIREQHVLVGPA